MAVILSKDQCNMFVVLRTRYRTQSLNIRFVDFISDTAKSDNTAEDMIVYTSLKTATNLSVKFHMNPVSNYTVLWSFGSSDLLQNTNVRDTVEGHQVKTNYFISNVTKKELGSYIVRVINKAITSEKEVTFYVMLKLRGEKTKLF